MIVGKILRNDAAVEVQRCTGVPLVAIKCGCGRRGVWRTCRSVFDARCRCGAIFKVAAR